MKLQVFGETHFADFILTADLSSLACFQGVYHVGSNSMVPGLYNLSIEFISGLKKFSYKRTRDGLYRIEEGKQRR